MDITNSNNIKSKNIELNPKQNSSTINAQNTVDKTFSDELKSAAKADDNSENTVITKEDEKNNTVPKNEDNSITQATTETITENDNNQEQTDSSIKEDANKSLSLAFTDINEVVEEICKLNQTDNNIEDINGIQTDNNIEDINGIQTDNKVENINQKEEIQSDIIKQMPVLDDKDNIKEENEDLNLIDNNMNIQEPQEKINLQMGSNMSFSGDGQPFAEFVNQEKTNNTLSNNIKDLKEEKAIMSTMEENIAIANKNMALAKSNTNEAENTKKETKHVENEHGVYKVSNKTNLVVDTIVSYENIIMDKNDVEFFTNLVENGVVNMNEVTGGEKSSQVSKTLADMLAKAMNDNKPIRIDFDNNISVIIKIDRAGKISADFLPSSQVAEAYLKENLPLLKQRFDENNIDYNELNQRQRKQDTQDNRKKGRKDE